MPEIIDAKCMLEDWDSGIRGFGDEDLLKIRYIFGGGRMGGIRRRQQSRGTEGNPMTGDRQETGDRDMFFHYGFALLCTQCKRIRA